MKFQRAALSALLASSASFLPSAAFAQDTDPPAAVDPAEAQPQAEAPAQSGLEEIVVMARRRSESSQNIPVSITALSSAQIEREDISTIERISAKVPELIITNSSNGSGASLSIRGIGSNFSSVGIEQSVAVIVDGAYYGHGRIIDEGFFDLSRIEVLKGPQALFYGKNATAGVISITTADPGTTPDYRTRVGYEFNAQEVYGEVVASGPISETLGVRLALQASKQFGGLTKNLGVPAVYNVLDSATFTPFALASPVSDRDQPGTKDLIGRLTIKWTPTNRLTNVLKISGTRSRGGSPVANSFVGCPYGFFQSNPSIECGRKFTTYQNDPPAELVGGTATLRQGLYNRYDSYAINDTLTYDFDKMTLTSVMNYNHNRSRFNADYAQEGLGGIWVPIDSKWHAFSSETRILTNFGGRVNLLAGFLYQSTEREHEEDVTFFGAYNSLAPRRFQYLAFYKQSSTEGETLAGYAQIIGKLTPELEVTAGVRYTHETKDSDFNQDYVNPFFQGLFLQNQPISANQKFNNWSPDATITWRPSNDLTVYGSYKTGYKSGGFSNSAVQTAGDPTGINMVFEPERAKGFEAGIKSTLLDRQLRLNVGAYRYNFSDLQVDYFDPIVIQYITKNAGSSRVEGIELEMQYAPRAAAGLTLFANGNYNRSRYRSFIGPCWTGQSQAEGCNLFENTGSPLPTLQRLDGASAANAPKWVGRLGFNYETAVWDGMELGVSSDLRYSSRYNASPFDAPDTDQSSYAAIDASLRLGRADQRWELALIGKNLTNRQVLTGVMDISNSGSGTGTVAGGPHADFFGYSGPPRTVQMQLSVRF